MINRIVTITKTIKDLTLITIKKINNYFFDEDYIPFSEWFFYYGIMGIILISTTMTFIQVL